ncbi:PF13665 domain protein [Burkholderia aenigmatica]|uniref:PF13665 domain protein n=1 Tax=Burkholderia aenigmatica TaxID=2015348 RepID=A0A6P2Q8L8_9BURK|nr:MULTISPECIES: DUF4150 domain-containing protein [Burkholderia]VWC18533.1 PF13665 domain protein [Burkholderia aenigmatica]
MAEPLEITVTGDAGDVFREHFNIQSVEQARDAVKNLDALWNTPNPWSDRPDLRDIFDEAGKSVQRRFETGVYKPQDKAQPSDHFSKGNRIASRQDGSFKAVSSTPDVCKTPMGSSTPPVPYQVVSDLSGSSGIVPSVRFNGKPAYVLDQSVVPTCTGDEAGSADGVGSGTVGGETKPTKGSTTVRAGGHPVIRDGDPCTMNSGNCTGTYVTAPAPGSSVDASGNVAGDANPPPEKGVMHQVGGFFKGAGGAVWDMGKGLVGLGVGAAKLSPVSQAAEGLSDLTGLYDYHGYSQTLDSAGKTAQAIYDHPGAIVDGITKPYMEAWSQGNYGEALGRGMVDIGGLFAGGVGAAGKAGEVGNVAGKIGEAANVAGKMGEATNVAGKAGEVADVSSAVGKTGEAGAATAKGAEGAADVSKVAKPVEAGPAGDGLKISGKPKPGSLEHKAARWERYKARGGKKDYEAWSKQYDTNMRNYQFGAEREAAYRDAMGASEGTLKTPLTNRQIDILKADEMYAGQLKTGPVSLTKENILAIQKDGELVKQGWQVEHILEQGASKPYLDALEKAGVDAHIGPKIP